MEPSQEVNEIQTKQQPIQSLAPMSGDKHKIRHKNNLDKKMVTLSKFLSFVLRHGAKEKGYSMDEKGFVPVSEILKQKSNYKIKDILHVVENNDKKRFELIKRYANQEELYFIRAVQGHTIKGLDEDDLLETISDPAQIPMVVHGTDLKAWSQFIRFGGLKPMARTHVHFAVGYPGDQQVVSGMRYSTEIMIEIDVPKAMKSGIVFQRSKNNVILSRGINELVPYQFFSKVKQYNRENKTFTELDLRQYEHLLILDFEAQCLEGQKLDCQEIIEFPVICLDCKSGQVLFEFHHYVKPTVVPELTKFCTELTGITQDKVEKALLIDQVIKEMEKEFSKHGITEHNAIIVTCGQWDLNSCLKNEANYKKLVIPSILTKFINIKRVYEATMHKTAGGMPNMLSSLNLQLDGRHHSGIDDSRNICKIAKELMARGGIFGRQQAYTVQY